ncbi:MAG: restriction endonuclease subunit S, partial [Candidatus Thorarchaeota archaeon]
RIENLLSRLSAGIELLFTSKRKAGQYWNSLLRDAMRGNLTNQWRKPYQFAEVKDSDARPKWLPDSWDWSTLGEYITLNYGKGLTKKNRIDGPIPVYGSNGIIGYHSEYLVKDRSIIVGRKGSVGEVHRTSGSFWPIDTTYYATLSQALDFNFAYYLLLYLRLESLDKSTAIPGLNRNDVYALSIPLPPIEEQQCISKILEAHFNVVGNLVQHLNLVHKLSENLRYKVLHSAFSGKLVPQSDDDEPVGELLKRIQKDTKSKQTRLI